MNDEMTSDLWLDVRDTPNGQIVVGAYTTEELDAMELRSEVKSGMCRDLAELPATAHLDIRALAKILNRSTKSVQRAIRRGDLPKPFRFLGKCVWLAGTIVEHLQAKQKAALEKDARHKKQLERLLRHYEPRASAPEGPRTAAGGDRQEPPDSPPPQRPSAPAGRRSLAAMFPGDGMPFPPSACGEGGHEVPGGVPFAPPHSSAARPAARLRLAVTLSPAIPRLRLH